MAGVLKNFEEVNVVKLTVVIVILVVVVVVVVVVFDDVVVVVVFNLYPGQPWEVQAEDRPSDFAL